MRTARPPQCYGGWKVRAPIRSGCAGLWTQQFALPPTWTTPFPFPVAIRVAQRAAGSGASVGAFVHDDPAVHDDVLDAVAVLERLGIGGAVDDPGGVEDRDVGEPARSQPPAVADADLGRVERSHFADRIFEREQTAVARVDAQHPRERAEVARMRMTAAQRTFGGKC